MRQIDPFRGHLIDLNEEGAPESDRRRLLARSFTHDTLDSIEAAFSLAERSDTAPSRRGSAALGQELMTAEEYLRESACSPEEDRDEWCTAQDYLFETRFDKATTPTPEWDAELDDLRDRAERERPSCVIPGASDPALTFVSAGPKSPVRDQALTEAKKKEAFNEAIEHFHTVDANWESDQLLSAGGRQSQAELDDDIEQTMKAEYEAQYGSEDDVALGEIHDRASPHSDLSGKVKAVDEFEMLDPERSAILRRRATMGDEQEAAEQEHEYNEALGRWRESHENNGDGPL